MSTANSSQRRDARRRRNRRGHHRQSPHHPRHSAQTARQGLAGRSRGARRGLYGPARVFRPQRRARKSRRAGLRQSAQLGGRLGAPARRLDHRVAAAAFFRLCLGRGQRRVRRRRIGRRWRNSAPGASPSIRCRNYATASTQLLAFHRDIAAKRAELPYDIDGVVYKVDDLKLAGTARLRRARAALGDRA